MGRGEREGGGEQGEGDSKDRGESWERRGWGVGGGRGGREDGESGTQRLLSLVSYLNDVSIA